MAERHEIELKYLAQEEEVSRVTLALEKIGVEILNDRSKVHRTVYYDTLRCRLRTKAVELRVRETDSKFVQTVKSSHVKRGAVFEREENECALSTKFPDLNPLRNFIKSKSLTGLQCHHLKPVFETKVKRRSIDVRWKKSQIRIDIDQGVLSSCRRRIGDRHLCEIELELQNGRRQDLLLFGVELSNVMNLRLNAYTKSDFGYALALPRFALKPVNWDQVSANLDINASLKDLLSAAFLQLLKNNPDQIRDRLESIHQARVAIRRIRALLRGHKTRIEFLQRKGVNGELKWLQIKLGEARDWQVLQHDTLPAVCSELTSNSAKLEKYVGQQTKHHLANALSINSSRRLNRLFSRLLAWIDGLPNDPKADKKIRAKRLKTDLHNFVRLRRMPARAFLSNIHQLRIRTKKLRYMLEINNIDHDVSYAELSKNIKELQNALGKFNDLSKALELLSPAKTSELPIKINNEIRIIIGTKMDLLFAVSQEKFKLTKKTLRAVEKKS
jgi:inorganic triphosphatase YgiF